jgi:hypothetical protein
MAAWAAKTCHHVQIKYNYLLLKILLCLDVNIYVLQYTLQSLLQEPKIFKVDTTKSVTKTDTNILQKNMVRWKLHTEEIKLFI